MRQTTPTIEPDPRTATPHALQVENLEKHFGGLVALAGVSLWADPGQVTALVGDNGAGKSTLVKCVTGVHRPDGGSISLHGEPLILNSPDDARRAGIETVFQDLSLVDDLTVTQNFFLGRERTHGVGPFRWLDRAGMTSEVGAALSKLSVNTPSPRARVRRLSGGQRQAVSIARSVAFGTRLVIMDEPTASLGVRETAMVEDIIRRLRDNGVPILLISHNMQQVLRLSDRVWVLRAGHLAGGGVTSQLDGDSLVALITGTRAQ